eukprot:g19564.t1
MAPESRTEGGFVMVLTEETKRDAGLEEPLLTKDVGSVSAIALTMNLVNASLGSGALSLPWAAAGASMAASLGVTLLVLVLNAISNIILVERLQVFDLGAVLGHLPGAWARPLRLFFDVSIWCSVGLTTLGRTRKRLRSHGRGRTRGRTPLYRCVVDLCVALGV